MAPTTLPRSPRGFALALVLVLASPVFAAEPPIDYNRDIRPILAENCYACHGPDRNARKVDLRLDQKDEAFKHRESGTAIVPGKAEESLVIDRIASDDPNFVMPPPKSGKKLTAEQVALLQRWVEQGAQWQGHWAYQTPKRPEPPATSDLSWSRNPIDRFIRAALDAKGLQPSPEADRPTLIRRLSLDLTGLPPSPAEVDAFVNDQDPLAYDRLVDRLLASPHYGERMAQHWLDLARYADTNGYHIDNHRDIWKYREWVIDAFNRNLSFDKFTVEQLAGDLLPNPTVEQKIASGFNRNTMVNFEGGADPEEYLTKYVVDRVNTTASVYLGTTLACAECHDHKYDPFTQVDFYKLYAFFNTVAEKGLDGNYESPAPRMKVPSAEQSAKLAGLRKQLAHVEGQLRGQLPRVDAAQAIWERERGERLSNPLLGWKAVEPLAATSKGGATLVRQGDLSVLASGNNPDKDVYEVVASTRLTGIRAIRLEALTDPSLPHKGTARSDNANFALSGFELEVSPEGKPDQVRTISFTRALADHHQTRGGDFDITKALDSDPNTAWSVDGDQRRENRQAYFVAKAPFGFEGGTTLKVRLRFEFPSPKHSIGKFRLSLTVADDPELPTPASTKADAIVALASEARNDTQKAELRDYFRRNLSSEGQALVAMVDAIRKEEQALDKAIPVTMVMEEMNPPRMTHVLTRGDFRAKGTVVTPGVPASLPPLPAGAPANRLGLAKWLVDPSHPLTARVTVNRFWQQYFGTGLVKTANDFGTQGEWPTHPELLDWLATEFIASGWDVKALQRLIVTSATYRQASKVDPTLRERDPENRFLARGPRFRLDAEAIRDTALAASGLLDRRLGGPSVYPYQPPGLWEELSIGREFSSQSYVQSHGPDLYRRGMYTYWKRSMPYPPFTALDAPNREVCAVTRPRTNTPLQALTLLNDPGFLEAARALATRTMKEGGTDVESRAAFAFKLCVARAPKPEELSVLVRVYEQQLERYRQDRASAEKMIKVGESPRPMDLDASELAAWTAVGNVLLNLDETLTKG